MPNTTLFGYGFQVRTILSKDLEPTRALIETWKNQYKDKYEFYWMPGDTIDYDSDADDDQDIDEYLVLQRDTYIEFSTIKGDIFEHRSVERLPEPDEVAAIHLAMVINEHKDHIVCVTKPAWHLFHFHEE